LWHGTDSGLALLWFIPSICGWSAHLYKTNPTSIARNSPPENHQELFFAAGDFLKEMAYHESRAKYMTSAKHLLVLVAKTNQQKLNEMECKKIMSYGMTV